MKKIAFLVVLLISTLTVLADTPATVKIKTSANCEMCKARLEKNVAFVKGVKDVNLDLTDKVMTVSYNPKKVSVDKIKKAITDTGYDADELQKNEESHSKLPGCCRKKTGASSHEGHQ